MTAMSRRQITTMITEFAHEWDATTTLTDQSALVNRLADRIIAEADESYESGYESGKRGDDYPDTTGDVLTNMIMRHQHEDDTLKIMRELPALTPAPAVNAPEAFYPTLPA